MNLKIRIINIDWFTLTLNSIKQQLIFNYSVHFIYKTSFMSCYVEKYIGIKNKIEINKTEMRID